MVNSGHGRLRRRDDGLGRPDRLSHQRPDRRRAGDPHPERHETCTATTDATGTASCSITPSEAAGHLLADRQLRRRLHARRLQLTPSNGSANFVVTLEETTLSYTGADDGAERAAAHAVSGVLTTDDPAAGHRDRRPDGRLHAGHRVIGTDVLGARRPDGRGLVHHRGDRPVARARSRSTASFAGDGYYRTASAASTVNLPEGTAADDDPDRRHLQRLDDGHGHADQHLHQPAGAERAGDLERERHASVHGDDQRQRRRLVPGHADRAPRAPTR